MNKYREKSDFEINCAVFVAAKINHEDTSIHDGKVFYGDGANWIEFDPCNNPADAMPIITENKIDLTHLVGGMVCAKHKEYWCIRKNPYRAGCEVYLLMKDAENEK